MPQPLPEIQGVDNSANYINALHQGIVDRQLQQNYDNQQQNALINQNVGNALIGENPNMPASQRTALQDGKLDLYGQLHGWAQKASDDEHEQAAKAHEVTANLLSVIAKEPDPNKQQMYWEQAKKTASDLGMDQNEIGKLDQMTKQFGISGALNFEAARVGKQADIIQAAQDQRTQQNKDIAQGFAALSPDDEAGHVQVLKNLQAQGNSRASQYLTPEGELAPGARASALGLGGLGGDVMRYNAKAAQGGGGKQSALNQATQNVIEGTLKRYPNLSKEDVPLDLAQSAAAARGTLEFDGDRWTLMNPDGSTAAIRQQMANTMAKRYDPSVTAANAYAREGSKSNVKLDTQMNRLASVKDQIQQLRDMAGEEGSPERDDFNSSIGWLTSHSGRQYWGSGNVPAVMSSMHSKVSTLQDELAQYVQSSGAGSDVRAKKAYDVVGDLQNSPDPQTFLKRLNSIEQTVESLRKVPHINASGAGKQATAPSAPQASNAQLPKVGAIEDGYRFKGGDPSQASNWEPVR